MAFVRGHLWVCRLPRCRTGLTVIVIEIPILIGLTVAYLIFISLFSSVSAITQSSSTPVRPSSPAINSPSRVYTDGRRPSLPTNPINKDNNLTSRIWMSEPRNYRYGLLFSLTSMKLKKIIYSTFIHFCMYTETHQTMVR